MIYLESHNKNPYFNLSLEEYLFEQMDRKQSYLMLWQNDNAIVVGKYQNTVEEINQAYVDANHIRVVRRLSGGGAVYHDMGNLNFTFIVDEADIHALDFKIFAEFVIKALAHFGVQTELSGRNDLIVCGKKISGGAQYARHGRLLHHGCIMLDTNLTRLTDALRVNKAKFDSKAIKSVRTRVTTVNAQAPSPISMEQFKAALLESAMTRWNLTPYTLTEKDLTAIYKLRDEKYATWEWNYGHSPAYDMRREMKFPAGLVTAHLNVEQGRIKAVKFYGDFFGCAELSELESAMAGLPLDGRLTESLESLCIERYMSGITAENLSRLLRG